MHKSFKKSIKLLTFVMKIFEMKTILANEKLNTIISLVEKKGVDNPKLIEELKSLRVMALTEKDPLVVKVLRLTYEFLTENAAFSVQAQYEEDEEGNEYPIEIDEKENLLYLLSLLENAEQKLNREELKDYRDALKAELY